MSSDNTNEDTDDSGTAETSAPSAEASMPSVKKNWYKRPLGIAVLAIVVLAIGAAAFTTLTGQQDDTDSGSSRRGRASQTGRSNQDSQAGADSSRSAIRQTEGGTVAIVPLDLASEITRSGTYLVGIDIAPGTWINTYQSYDCIFSVYRNASLSDESRIRTYRGGLIEKGVPLQTNQYFTTGDDCEEWELDSQRSTTSESLTSIPSNRNGTFLVGTDIAPGTWTSTFQSDDCIFSVYRNASLSDESRIRTYRGSPDEKSVALRTDQYFTTGDECAEWELDSQRSTTSESLESIPSYSNGTFLVGTDIAPGTWTTTNTDDEADCEFAVYSNASFSNISFPDESRSRYYQGGPDGKSVTLRTDQYFTTSDKCGGWDFSSQGSTPAEPMTLIPSYRTLFSSYRSGTYLVGTDIAPGTWTNISTYESDNCEFYIYSNASFSDESRIRYYQGSPDGKSVTLQTNQYFHTSTYNSTNDDCGGWELSSQGSAPAQSLTSIPDYRNRGTFLVGTDIAPGTWTSISNYESANCEFVIYNNASLSEDSIIRVYEGSPIGKSVTLRTGQYFEINDDCDNWELGSQGSAPAELLTSIPSYSSGTFLVGTDIAPGTWTNTSTYGDADCEFAVYSNAPRLDSLSGESLVRAYYGSPVGKSVTLQTNQYFATGDDCDEWELDNQRSAPIEPLTSITRDGIFLVGVDIAPGTWISTNTFASADCEFSIYSNASLSEDSRIRTYEGSPVEKSAIVRANQYLVTNYNCSDWELDGR